MTNIIVTGGAGYIGSHACKRLKNLGFNPISLDNLATGHKHAVKYGPLEEIDLRDSQQLNSIFTKYQPIAVMHFAAKSIVSEGEADPINYWDNNLKSTLNLLQACEFTGCKNFIFSSTCATYGNHPTGLLDENTPQVPTTVYGSTKLASEMAIKNMGVAGKLNFCIFRYFNVSGSDKGLEIGEFHEPETHLIPVAINAALSKNKEFYVNGNDYPTPDGTCIRDYIHVIDLVDAHIIGLNKLLKSSGQLIFNLGSRVGYSVHEVIEEVEKVANCKLNKVVRARRIGDVTKLLSNSSKFTEHFEWVPKHSNLDEMVQDTFNWLVKQKP